MIFKWQFTDTLYSPIIVCFAIFYDFLFCPTTLVICVMMTRFNKLKELDKLKLLLCDLLLPKWSLILFIHSYKQHITYVCVEIQKVTYWPVCGSKYDLRYIAVHINHYQLAVDINRFNSLLSIRKAGECGIRATPMLENIDKLTTDTRTHLNALFELVLTKSTHLWLRNGSVTRKSFEGLLSTNQSFYWIFFKSATLHQVKKSQRYL